MQHSSEELTGSILHRKNIKRGSNGGGGGKELSSEKLTPGTVVRSDDPSRRAERSGRLE